MKKKVKIKLVSFYGKGKTLQGFENDIANFVNEGWEIKGIGGSISGGGGWVILQKETGKKGE